MRAGIFVSFIHCSLPGALPDTQQAFNKHVLDGSTALWQLTVLLLEPRRMTSNSWGEVGEATGSQRGDGRLAGKKEVKMYHTNQ